MTQERISKLIDQAKASEAKEEEFFSAIRSFTSLLYAELNKTVEIFHAEGVRQLSMVRTNQENGFQAAQLTWNLRTFSIVPMPFAALPTPENSDLENVFPKDEPVGRIVIFWQIRESEIAPFAEIYLTSNREWYAYGMIGIIPKTSFEEGAISYLALSLLESMIVVGRSSHHALQNTRPGPPQPPQPRKRELGFPTPNP